MLTLLEKIAKALIKKHKPLVICITGSVGKTSTKDAIAAALSTSFIIRKTPKNLNNEYGVPISIIGGFKFREGFLMLLEIAINGIKQLIHGNFPQVLVIEVGAGRIGEIKRVSEWLKPDILVLTNLPETPSHLGVFGSKDKIIEEKKHLANVMTKDGVLIISSLDENVAKYIKNFPGKIINCEKEIAESKKTYSVVMAEVDKYLFPKGIKFSYGRDNNFEFQGFIGSQNINAVLLAFTVAKVVGCDESFVLQGLESYLPEAGRLRLLKGVINDTIIVDDSFNSSPIAVENSLRSFFEFELNTKQRKIAVLGDMLNLGENSASIHDKTAVEYINNVDILITVAKESEIWQKYNINKYKKNKHFRNSTDAAKYLEENLEPGDVLLFKGGHLVRLEKAIKILTNALESDLVRQEDYWQKGFELYSPISYEK
jgi:UDP-N-acetylmuramoyl-tripeptide--D-alanyl-D-alanine ligase